MLVPRTLMDPLTDALHGAPTHSARVGATCVNMRTLSRDIFQRIRTIPTDTRIRGGSIIAQRASAFILVKEPSCADPFSFQALSFP